jgi:transcription initiation factor IIE alpha subunit
MLAPESENINKDSPIAPVADLFVCGLCRFIVTPFPLQCSLCNSLYCEECVKNLYKFKCPNRSCKDTAKPEELHRSVREVLEQLHFSCPGCKEDFRYVDAFAHVATCPKIGADSRFVDPSSLGKIVA